MLNQNSQAFLKQEKQHITGFRHAQNMQRKILDSLAESGSLKTLEPISKSHFTQRNSSLQLRKKQANML